MRIIKISFALLISLIVSTSMFAQLPLTFGVKAGMNLSEIQKMEDKIKVGFNIGVTAELALPSNFYLLSGLEFTTKGAKGKEMSLTLPGGKNSVTDKASYNAMYLQLPIHAGYKFDIAPGTKLLVHLGPYFAYGVGGKIKWDKKEIEDQDFFHDDSNKFDFGIGGAVGVEFFERIEISLAADQGLTKIYKDTKMKNRAAYINLGYKF
ncbi:porin family protein [Prevotella sp. 10(H)]|uniref:porin family protein n=1 Tax=Prevotella sp. 10(H) TaxID=1158294 RepID=UPI0004A6E6E4|nr:porin family protein [Prevotella sp. 10(H)]